MSDAPAENSWPTPPDRLRPPGMPAELLRASDGDRDVVVRALSDAFARGRLTPEEHADRVARALNARTLGDLAPLTHDLAVGRPTASPGWSYGPPDESGATAVVSVFGGAKRAGRWRVPARLYSLTLFGGTELDLRDASFTSPTVDVDLLCMFGGVKVVVPEGVAVENQVFSLFGGSEAPGTLPDPGAPTVRLRGLCLFGGVSAKVQPRTPPGFPPAFGGPGAAGPVR